MMNLFFDYDGNTISQQIWQELFSDTEGRMIATSVIEEETHVSTVWIGLGSGIVAGPPLIYETMVFSSDGDIDGLCQRTSTREQALGMHNAIVYSIEQVGWIDEGLLESFTEPEPEPQNPKFHLQRRRC